MVASQSSPIKKPPAKKMAAKKAASRKVKFSEDLNVVIRYVQEVSVPIKYFYPGGDTSEAPSMVSEEELLGWAKIEAFRNHGNRKASSIYSQLSEYYIVGPEAGEPEVKENEGDPDIVVLEETLDIEFVNDMD